jgi:hypothetical protein
MSPEHRGTGFERVQANAYKAYLKALREGLAEVDIDALEVTSPAIIAYCYCCSCTTHCHCVSGPCIQVSQE